jgi:hypothetical protein
MFLLVLFKLPPSLHPRGFMSIVAKAQIVELDASFGRHVRRLALLHEHVMAPLFLDPQSQLGEFLIIQRHLAMAMFVTKASQVGHVIGPGRFLCIPREIKCLQMLNPGWSNGALFVVLEQLVLLSLLGYLSAKEQ